MDGTILQDGFETGAASSSWSEVWSADNSDGVVSGVAHSGSHSYRIRYAHDEDAGKLIKYEIPDQTEYYLRFWQMYPDGFLQRNLKQARFFNSSGLSYEATMTVCLWGAVDGNTSPEHVLFYTEFLGTAGGPVSDWRDFPIHAGEWYKTAFYVKLNDPGATNGIYRLWRNDQIIVDLSNVDYRTYNSFPDGFWVGGNYSGAGVAPVPFDRYIDDVFAATTPADDVAGPNHAPVLEAIPAQSVVAGQTLQLLARASDVDGNAIAYSLLPGSPNGAQIHPVTGGFAWTPPANSAPGTYQFTVRATDNGTPSLFDSKTFSVTVRSPQRNNDDLFARDASTGLLQVARSTGNSFSSSNWNLVTSSGAAVDARQWVDVHSDDFNGDGIDDVVGRNPSTGQWHVGITNGNVFVTSVWATWSSSANWSDVKTGDFNGDGKADLAGRQQATGAWNVAISNGSAFTTSTWGAWNTTLTWVDVNVGDFNADGKADLIGRSKTNGLWYVALSSGTTLNTSIWSSWAAGADWVDVNLGDFDGDGKADVIGRVKTDGTWWIGRSMSTGFVTSYRGQWSATVDWVDVRIGDFTGDGKDDVIGRWRQTGQWWCGVSNGVQLANRYFGAWTGTDAAPNLTWVDIVVGDFNRDGKQDIAGRWRQTGQIYGGLSNGAAFANAHWATWSSIANWTDVQAAALST